MLNEINIIHMADLHIKKSDVKDIDIVITALLKDLNYFKNYNNITYDCICFSGDLIYRGDHGLKEENQFYLAEEHFIFPVLTELDLDYDRFYYCPGNHEVNRTSIDKYQDEGIKSNLSDKGSINNFIDNLKESYLNRLSEYISFRNNIFGQYCHTNTSLYSTYKFKKGNNEIGVACLNSSWLSGGDKDYGTLVVGERQVDNAYEDISSCTYKVAIMHHPTNWLVEYDKRAIDLALNKFDLVLTGHLHDSIGTNNIYSNNSSNVTSSCGSLFNGSRASWYNGYTIININFLENTTTLFFREYFDDRREFDKSLRVCKDGKITFENNKQNNIITKNVEYIKNVREGLIDKFNKTLIPSLLKNMAPKELKKMFVEPNLSLESEYKKEEDTSDDNKVLLNDLIESNDNIMFIGKKELGKTTLLNYICLHYMENFSNKLIVPFIIDFNELPKGKDLLEKYIISFLLDYNYSITKEEIQEQLALGECVILIDNLDINNNKHLKTLNEFIGRYGKNRFLFATNEQFIHTLSLDEYPSLSINYQKVYLHTLDRNKIRTLIDNWFSTRDDINTNIILDKITSNLHYINMPTTPLIISLILAVCEEQNDFEPINEAALLERFIELILEKISLEDIKTSTYGFKNKEHYLSELAWEMVINDSYCFSEQHYHDFTFDYHNQRALDLKSSKFDSLFFKKGILIKQNNKVYFRYKCFYEYFVAKKMFNDNDAYNFIIKSPSFLQFYNEIVFLSGLQGEGDNEKLLGYLANNLSSIIDSMEKDVYIKNLSELNIGYLFDLNDNILEDMEHNRLDSEEKDRILDRPHVKYTFQEQIITKDTPKKQSDKLFYLITLFARVLKNSESIKKDMKQNSLQLCIESYCFFIAVIIQRLEEKFSVEQLLEQLGDDYNNDETVIKNLDLLKDLIKITIPIAFQNLIYETVGSKKLELTIQELLQKTTNDFVKYMLVFLYADLNFHDYLGYIKRNASSLKSKDILNLYFFKLFYYYIMRDLNDRELKTIRSLISDILISLRRGNKYRKDYIIQKLIESKKQPGVNAKLLLETN